jgi:uncharacterized protein (DUF433 family)
MSVSIENLLEPVSHRHGRMCVKGTATTVHRIARWWRLGMTADEIADDFPHLSLAGVHAALAYYFANRQQIDAEIDAEIEEERRLVKEHSKRKIRVEKETV